MKNFRKIEWQKYASVILALMLVHVLHAVPPKTEDMDYSHIVSKAPFAPLVEKKPVVKVEPPEPVAPRVDWILKGATKFDDGWMVVIANKKSPGVDVIVTEKNNGEGNPSIVSVKPNNTDYTLTKVELKMPTGLVQTVEFNEKAMSSLQQQATKSSSKPTKTATPTRSSSKPSNSKSDSSREVNKPRRITIPRQPSTTNK